MVDCDARLKPLFAGSFPEIKVVSSAAPGHELDREFAAHLLCGSLPGLFRTSEDALAGTTSRCLVADPVAREQLRNSYSDGRRLVGLARFTKNRRTGRTALSTFRFSPRSSRSLIFDALACNYGDPNGLESQKVVAVAPLLIDRSVNPFANIDIFAAQIAAMDLVVTIDNSKAHLADALGVPVFLLLPFACDWRWLQAREDSPWYPTLPPFRQPKLGKWQFVMQAVLNAL